MDLKFTQNQTHQLSDAAHEVITRMLGEGQDDAEIRLHALAELWGAYKALHLSMLGSLDTPAIQRLEPQVLAAIANPKRRDA